MKDKGMIKDLPKEIREMVEKTFEATMEVKEKRDAQKKETWIKNVMRIEGKTREEAEKLHKKINK